MPSLSKEYVSEMVVEYLKKKKSTERIDVAMIEQDNDCWVIRGTSPIEFGETHWPEKFVVVIDSKGNLKSEEYALL